MSDDSIKKIFAKNLNYYLQKNNKTQADLVKYIGISSSTVSNWCTAQKMPRADKIQSIANWLGIQIGDLMEEHSYSLNKKDSKDIEKILDQTREQLLSQDGLMFDGDPASPEAIDSILSAMQIGMEMAKKKNKEKYTPKKYMKD